MVTGIVATFDDAKGFGTVREDDTGVEHFFHCTAIADGTPDDRRRHGRFVRRRPRSERTMGGEDDQAEVATGSTRPRRSPEPCSCT